MAKKKFLFFDASFKFDLKKKSKWSEDFCVIAGLVASQNTFNSILYGDLKFFQINKRHRTKEFKRVAEILFEKLSNDFKIYISIYHSKIFELTKPEIDTYNLGKNLSPCKFEKGEKGIIGRYWAESQWIPVQKLKDAGITPILCMDNEEEDNTKDSVIIKICKCHFANQIGSKNVENPENFYVKKKTDPDYPIANAKQFFQLSDYVALYFSSSLRNKVFPRFPDNLNLRINFMFAYPLNLVTSPVSHRFLKQHSSFEQIIEHLKNG